MLNSNILKVALGGFTEIQEDWMPASQLRAFIREDPILVWLDHHGERNDFQKDSSPYEFIDFIFEKGNQFEAKWVSEMAPEAIRVCEHPWDVKLKEKVLQTWELMTTGTPVISQPALWWAPEKIYGVPDLIVHSNWLVDEFPDYIDPQTANHPAENFGWNEGDGHYLVIDIKFTTDLTSSRKATDFKNYSSQIRIYTYILGNLQGFMPSKGYIVQREPVDELLPLEIRSDLGEPLEQDLSSIRDRYVDIKLHGESFKPWNISFLLPNLSNTKDAPWHSAKVKIASDYIPGSDPCLVYQIGQQQKQKLKEMGYPSLDSLLSANPEDIDFEECKGLGKVYCSRIRRVLEANSTEALVPSCPTKIPKRKDYEFFVDFETFNNLNVDFDRQWPTLEGCEMIFMIGVGWEERGNWEFEKFVTNSESPSAEENMIDEFIFFLNSKTTGHWDNNDDVALYHWSNAEVWQLRRAANRHRKRSDHLWRRLPWFDLEKKVFHAEPIGVPGAWNFKLKEIAGALNEYDANCDLVWPGNLDDGLRAMVMGWKAYQQPNPIASKEMQTIIEYNEVDCKAIWKILNWLRALFDKRRVESRKKENG